MFTVPFHFPFHRSVPYSIPVIRDALSHVTINVSQNANVVTGLMGEHKSPKNSHLMIFMRALLTDGVQVCPVKAYRTELATTCPCMALTAIHDSEIQRTYQPGTLL